ncbi:MAG: efflux transporter outer membrane subunit [Casimicrobiaceae bacterium]
MRNSLPAIALAVALAIAGCTTTPTAPPQLDLPAASAAPVPREALARWWTAFGDPTLDKLVDEARANNLDLSAAMARVQLARAQVTLSQADLFPSVDLGVGASRSRSTQSGSNPLPSNFSPYSNDFRVALRASYEVDLWSKFRTATRAAQADLLASQYGQEVVRTMVEADTARFYFNLLAADAQLSLLQQTLKTRNESVELQTDRYNAGIIGDYDLGTAQAERASVMADIAAARRAVVEYESALAVLLGRSPREVYTPALARDVAMTTMTTVPAIPAGLPSDLLARRPDIRQAEAQLAAANLRIDVARADYYPSISLTGAFGTEAGALKNLFSGPAAIWTLAGALLQPLFGLQAIDANVEAQTARRNAVVVSYTKTVQAAFRDAHDALSANETTRAGLAAQTERKDRLAHVLELSDLRYRSGYSPYLEVLDAQRQLLQAQTLQIIAARNVRLSAVDLATALGGGWDTDGAVTPPTSLVGAGSGSSR